MRMVGVLLVSSPSLSLIFGDFERLCLIDVPTAGASDVERAVREGGRMRPCRR